MRRLSKFLALSASDRLLVLRCLLVMAGTRAGLSILSYKALRQLMQVEPATTAKSAEHLTRIIWGVHKAARLVPRASCLTQVIAAQFLLARAGQRTQIRIGVAKGAGGEFLAHAWLISDDRIVLGGSSRDIERYTRLVDLDTKPS